MEAGLCCSKKMLRSSSPKMLSAIGLEGRVCDVVLVGNWVGAKRSHFTIIPLLLHGSSWESSSLNIVSLKIKLKWLVNQQKA